MLSAVFCAEPFAPRRPDPDYAAEVEAAESAGLQGALISHEVLVEEGRPEAAVRLVTPVDPPRLGIYRGWMMSPPTYATLHTELLARGIHLINDPAAYLHCHYLPEWYDELRDVTPRSVWLDQESGLSMERILPAAASLGPTPFIVKDYVKSRKHEWDEACFIPSALDQAAIERVVGRFMELQGVDLAGGLVLREFVELASIGRHPRSGMPLSLEFRLFILDGTVLATAPYWEVGDYQETAPPLEWCEEIAHRVPSRFFTMDVARRIDGTWIVVELGDGQVAGLPERMDPEQFYRAIAERNPEPGV
jgi:hypothetical protein